MKTYYSRKNVNTFFLILFAVFILSAITADAAQYKVADVFSSTETPNKGIKVGSYYINCKEFTLTASKIKNGKKINKKVLDTNCGYDCTCSIISNGKTVYYFKDSKKRQWRTLYKINVNGKGKKKLLSVKGVFPCFYNILGNNIYFICAAYIKNSEDNYSGRLYSYNIKTGKLKTILKYDGSAFSYTGAKYFTIMKQKPGSYTNYIIFRFFNYTQQKIEKTFIIKNVNGSVIDEWVVGKNLYIAPGLLEQSATKTEYKNAIYRVSLTGNPKPVKIFEICEDIFVELVNQRYAYYNTQHSNKFRFYRYNLKTKTIEKITKKRYLKLTGFPKENYD